MSRVKRIFALATASFSAYMAGFLSVATLFTYAIVGPPFSETLYVLGNSIPFILAAGTAGGAIVTGHSVVRRKQIAQATVGRWISALVGAGALHFGIVALIGWSGVHLSTIGTTVFMISAPLLASTVVLQKKVLGLNPAPHQIST